MSLALCCVSTGLFGFPAAPAAVIALAVTNEYFTLRNTIMPNTVIPTTESHCDVVTSNIAVTDAEQHNAQTFEDNLSGVIFTDKPRYHMMLNTPYIAILRLGLI